MKKLSIVAAGLLIAVTVQAAERVQNIMSKSTGNTTATPSIAFTNNGDRLLIRSVWASTSSLTNGTLKLVNATGVTNDIPVTHLNATTYWIPAAPVQWEGGAVLLFGAVLANTNPVTTTLQVYVAKPE
jgi:hypothetical protein